MLGGSTSVREMQQLRSVPCQHSWVMLVPGIFAMVPGMIAESNEEKKKNNQQQG